MGPAAALAFISGAKVARDRPPRRRCWQIWLWDAHHLWPNPLRIRRGGRPCLCSPEGVVPRGASRSLVSNDSEPVSYAPARRVGLRDRVGMDASGSGAVRVTRTPGKNKSGSGCLAAQLGNQGISGN